MLLPVLWRVGKSIRRAGKARLSKDLFFKASAHPVLAGGSEGGLIPKIKLWMRAVEGSFLLCGAVAHTAPAWMASCFSRQNPGKSGVLSNQLRTLFAKVNTRVGDELSAPRMVSCPSHQSQVNRSLLRKTRGLCLIKTIRENNHRGRGTAPCPALRAPCRVFSTLQRKGLAPRAASIPLVWV